MLCDPMDCSPPDSSVHGIFQARILEWVAMPSSMGSQPIDRTPVSCTAGGFFTAEPPVKPSPCYRAPHYSQDSMAVSAGLDIGGTHGSPIECAPTPKIPGSARPQFRLPEPLGGGVDSGGEKLEEGPRFFFEERIQQRDQDCEKDKSVY